MVLPGVPYLVSGDNISSGIYQPKSTEGWSVSKRYPLKFTLEKMKYPSREMEKFWLLHYSPCPPAALSLNKLLSQHSPETQGAYIKKEAKA